ncbi:hypothetical protein SAMN04487770_12230 [Butyrivibrio sp. ob235]|uniref:hypothetical protein n=1 Tax=Butyrivibrio sp. ob235 TaxID=1761780 RepID=UPI0008D49B38|nr:hypothetical protein [Butyrivibrio sp. ob235]SEL97059.1 hypothetical protein SAMN04487770_12230 [Butyrivibrio sp. ob235]
MASKTISRLLNRSNKNIYISSFNEDNKVADSFASYCFDEIKSNISLDHDYDSTEKKYEEQSEEESFFVSEKVIFEHFEKEKKLLGTIASVNYAEHTFSAILVSTDDGISRDVVFSLDDLSEEQKAFVEVGRRIIYIYGKQYRNGTVTNVSCIHFRNNSRWTQREIELKEKRAMELYNLLNDGM